MGTPEVWQVLLVVVTIVSVWMKTRDERVKTKIRIEADESAARVKQIEADIQIRVQEAKNTADEQAFQREQAKRQLEINDGLIENNKQFQHSLEEKEKRDESNYLTLKRLQDDNTNRLMGEIQTQKRRLQKVITQHEEAATRERAAMREDIRSFIEELGKSYFAGIQTLGSEIGMTLSRQMAIQNLDKELIPFPPAEDPRWKRVFITPNKPEVWLFKQPWMYDDVRLQKPCAQIKAQGHWVQIISGQVQGWLIVMKENGETCYGYLPDYAVKIHETEPAKLETAPA